MIEINDSEDDNDNTYINNKESLQYNFYIKKDFTFCLNIIRHILLNNNNNNNKHNCNRNPKCFCIPLGQMLLKICHNSKLSILQEFTNLYDHPELNLPLILFLSFCNGLIQAFDFQSCYNVIQSYLTISSNEHNQLPIEHKKTITHLLIFNCILITEGFDNTLSILQTINFIDFDIKIEFHKELTMIKKHYESLNNQVGIGKELVVNKINMRFKPIEIIPVKKEENTLIGKISSILLNKKFIGIIFIHVISIIFWRIYKDFNLGRSSVVGYIINNPIIKNIHNFLQVLLFNFN